MKIFLLILAPPAFAILSLALLTSWYTALVLLVILGGFIYLAIRRNDKHHESEQYDDHLILTEERRSELLDEIQKSVEDKKA